MRDENSHQYSRRDMLHGITAVSAIGLLSGSVLSGSVSGVVPRSNQDSRLSDANLSPESTENKTAQVATARGDLLANADVQVFETDSAPSDITRIATATTDENGYFTVSAEDQSIVLIKGVVDGETWFLVRPFRSISDNESITAEELLIYGPEVSRGVENDLPYAVITVWATYDSDYPREAELHVEITNVLTNAHKLDDYNQYDVDATLPDTNYDLRGGINSLTYPGDSGIVIHDGVFRTSSRFGWMSSEVAQTPDDDQTGSNGNIETDVYSTFHPVNSDSLALPVYPLTFWNQMELTDDERFNMNQSNREAVETIEQGTGEILGLLPGLGSALKVFQTLDWGLGIIFDQRETVLPSDAEIQSTDPNEYETVSMGWNGKTDDGADNAVSAVANFPIKFTDPGPVEFTTQAEWRKPNPNPVEPDKDIYGRFSKTFTLRPIANVSPITGQEKPTDPDTDGRYEDVNGDGELGMADVELLADNIDSEAVSSHVEAFDFNGNGRVDYNDVIKLQEEIS